MPRNKNAGKHPSYKKRGMSTASIKKKRKYDKELSQRPEQKKKRAECNKKRREATKKGQNIKGKDYDHAVNKFVSTAKNRGRKNEGGRRKTTTTRRN